MKTSKRFGVLILSLILWVIFLLPRLVIGTIQLIKTILSIVEKLLIYLIKLIQDETIKKV